jgi:hypothetical protein
MNARPQDEGNGDTSQVFIKPCCSCYDDKVEEKPNYRVNHRVLEDGGRDATDEKVPVFRDPTTGKLLPVHKRT